MDRDEIRSRLKDNLQRVEARIAAACARAGRKREDVHLVAVTKYVEPEIAALLPELGINHLGESRPQELWRKAGEIRGNVVWHLIGHLQRNKVEKTLPFVAVIHSVDSERLLDEISKEAARIRRSIDVLLEVNLSREPNKHGFEVENLPLLDPSFRWRHTHVIPVGLMTMAAASDNPEISRSTFAELRQLRDRIHALGTAANDRRSDVRELSMGMTNDFEVAIEEGATMVRIGSALFEGIPHD